MHILNRHMIEVHEQMFQCDRCGQTLSCRESLRRHQAGHDSGEKPIKCLKCPKSFLFVSHLRSHMRTHSSTKDHVCPAGNCGKTFKHKGDLKHHFAAKHEAPDELKQCRKCPLTFQTIKLLRLHSVIHQPPARRCPHCEEVFHWHSQVRNHVRNHHKSSC